LKVESSWSWGLGAVDVLANGKQVLWHRKVRFWLWIQPVDVFVDELDLGALGFEGVDPLFPLDQSQYRIAKDHNQPMLRVIVR
jgi:hypothetical protein